MYLVYSNINKSIGGILVADFLEIKVDSTTYLKKLDTIESEVGCVVISTPFSEDDINKPFKYDPMNQKYIDYINEIILRASEKLKKGGLIFIYGAPKWLPYFSLALNNTNDMLFKYWIALDIGKRTAQQGLDNTHVGLLMYLKGKNEPFTLNTDTVRVPYVACSACGKNIKDWGGKKHLINKAGSCISDVWKDYYLVTGEVEDPQVEGLRLQKIDVSGSIINDITVIPEPVLKRIIALVENGSKIVHIICEPLYEENMQFILDEGTKNDSKCDLPSDIYLGDCVELMKRWVEQYPDGCFDLIFADPPYNLDKDYSNYNDNDRDMDYIQWCNEWLSLCAKLLKPNGSLLVLNLPKWAVYHATLLNRELFFRNWIVWDALSTPKGKIMPAHYALLYYTKSQMCTFNDDKELTMIDTPDYCLRSSCINKRKRFGDDKKIHLSDIWTDISRIKHKRDRDDHPCQLPEKLMERIIKLFSKEGDFVFDPFSGAGTTAIVAKKLGRKYAAIDISEEYVNIGKKKLEQISIVGDVIKTSVKKPKRKVTKKAIELYIQSICLNMGFRPTEEEFISILQDDTTVEFTLEDIIELYGDVKTALKSGRIVLKQLQNT
jgi:site-specific DNA-methyltransferase (adenine-specific)